MEKIAESVEKLQEELLLNFKDLEANILLLDCLIQHAGKAFSTTGKYSQENRSLALQHTAGHIQQYTGDLAAITALIVKRLKEESVQ